MLEAMKTTLREELNVESIKFKRVALLKEDIAKYKLPHSPEAIKKGDTRTIKHIAEYGELAVELDALSPAVLEGKIREAIEAELNINLFRYEQGLNAQELDKLRDIKTKVTNLVSSVIQ